MKEPNSARIKFVHCLNSVWTLRTLSTMVDCIFNAMDVTCGHQLRHLLWTSPFVVNLSYGTLRAPRTRIIYWYPSAHWFHYVDDTWIKIKADQLVPFFDQIEIDNVTKYSEFTQKEFKYGILAFLDCLVSIVSDGGLHTSVYRKNTHTDQYLLFDSHHPLVQKLRVIRTWFQRNLFGWRREG